MAVVWAKRSRDPAGESMSAAPPQAQAAMASRQAVIVRRPSPASPAT